MTSPSQYVSDALMSGCLSGLKCLPPEAAHTATLCALNLGARAGLPQAFQASQPRLRCQLGGHGLTNPIGLAAGFDKAASAIGPLQRLGFGFLEVGGVTPLPQDGNPRPRAFRLPKSQAIINRMGFNNPGMEAVAQNIITARANGLRCPLAVNIGKNKESRDAIADYVTVAQHMAPIADYLVLNISSPNTPGLRNLQAPEVLKDLINAVREARASACDKHGPSTSPPPALFIKLAPDLETQQAQMLVRVGVAAGAEGVIATNTTTDRPLAIEKNSHEIGGLSGPPLRDKAEQILSAIWQELRGEVPIIGVGGITTGADLYRRIRLGANAVQLYTALVWNGPSLIPQLCNDLSQRLEVDGFESIASAVGTLHP